MRQRRLTFYADLRIDRIEARPAMLELAIEAMINTHGEFDACEIVMVAVRKASTTSGRLQWTNDNDERIADAGNEEIAKKLGEGQGLLL